MTVRDVLRGMAGVGRQEERSFPPSWLAEQMEMMRYGGHAYWPQSSYGPTEAARVDGELGAVLGNGVVYGVVRTRVDLFAQARFAWRRLGSAPRPMASDLFGTTALAPLDNPAPLLEWCELDVATSGASVWVMDGAVLRRLPARWCSIVLGSQVDTDRPELAWDAHPIGLLFQPPEVPADRAETWAWGEVAYYAPERDPGARWRGMSYLRPAMQDIAADEGARQHLVAFWRNHATPNTVMTFPESATKETVEAFRDIFLSKHQGVEKAYRTAFLGGGADLKVVGSSLKELDSEHIRKQVHLDITLAAGVPPIAAGIHEGTFANAKESSRALADRKMRYLWARCAEAFRPLFPAPSGAELWVDPTGISALQSDALDDAQVQAQQAQTMRTLIDGGYEPQSVIVAVTTGDMTKLRHTGLVSVQLSTPGSVPAGGAA